MAKDNARGTPSSAWKDWLMARPIAHRGLHDLKTGIVENSTAAAQKAIAGDFAIECDVQLTSDNQVIVFHDFELDRLTNSSGVVSSFTALQLTMLTFRQGKGKIPALTEFLNIIAGKVPLMVEIKSDFSGKITLADQVAHALAQYRGPTAVKSFDPAVMAHLRSEKSDLGIDHIPLGMVAEATYDHPDWSFLDSGKKQQLEQFLHWNETRPDFLSYNVNHLPNAVPHLLRQALAIPVMTWTVRTTEQRALAAIWADQIIFEESAVGSSSN